LCAVNCLSTTTSMSSPLLVPPTSWQGNTRFAGVLGRSQFSDRANAYYPSRSLPYDIDALGYRPVARLSRRELDWGATAQEREPFVATPTSLQQRIQQGANHELHKSLSRREDIVKRELGLVSTREAAAATPSELFTSLHYALLADLLAISTSQPAVACAHRRAASRAG